MSAARADIAARRALLLHEVEHQRVELRRALQRWQQPLAMLDVACSVGHFVRVHPLVVSGGGALLGMLWRGPLSHLARRLWRWRRR